MRRFSWCLLGVMALTMPTWAEESRVAGSIASNWDAVYLNESRVGYIATTTDRVEAGGQQVFHSRLVSKVAVKRFNDSLQIQSLLDAFELADGRLYAIDLQMQMANNIQKTTGRLGTDGQFHVTVSSGGKATTQSIPWSNDIQGPHAHERLLKEKPMKPGDTLQSKVFLPEINVVAHRTLRALDYEMVKLVDGQTRRLLAIEDSNNQIPQKGKFWVDDKGEILKSEIPFGELVMASYRVPEAFALGKTQESNVDIGLQTLVKPDKPIPAAHKTQSVTYRLEFTDEDTAKAIPSSLYQEILSRNGNTVIVKVKHVEPSAATASDAKVDAEFVDSNGFIQADDSQVNEQAHKITAGETDAWKKVQLLEQWVDKNMSNRDFTIAFADAREVIRTRQGDCTEHAVLLAALCRAVDVPARVAMGLVYLEGTGSFGYHMWTEAFIDGNWYAADGTLGQGYVAGGHIKIADGSLKGASALSTLLPIFKFIGKMTIHVERIEPAAG